ncbi:MAG: DsbE family thiol:disulfide interchange protein [Pseudomonadota bacterium]
MVRFIVPLGIFLALTGLFVVGLKNDPTYIPSPLLAQPLPSFTLASLADPNEQVKSTDLGGRPTLLNVWGSWCYNCRVEHDFLMQLTRNGVIDIYGLNWKDPRADAQAWLARYGDPYVASGHDEEGRVAIDFGVYGAPETFLIDGDGTIVYKHIGPLSADIWANDFAPRLAQLTTEAVQ